MIAMRERLLKSKLYRVILWVILLSMGGSALIFSPFLKRSTRSSVLATINGKPIDISTYHARLASIFERVELFKQQYGEQSSLFLKLLGLENPQEIALKGVIIDELLNQKAAQLNIDLSQNYVMQRLQNPSVLLEELKDIVPLQIISPQGTIDFNALTYILQARGQTLSDFEKSVEHALERKMLTDLIGASIYISPQELKDIYTTHFLKRSYTILTFSLSDYVKKSQTEQVAFQDLQEFFARENKESKRYWVPEKRTASVLTFNPQQYGVVPSVKDIENYYQDNKHKKFIETPTQVQVRRIVLQVNEQNVATQKDLAQSIKAQLDKDATQFAELARKYSQDKETVSKGGLLGFIKRGQKDPAFERVAFKLKKDGEISDIFATGEGLEIIQRVSKQPMVFKPLAKVQEEIRSLLLNQRFKSKFIEDAQSVIDAYKQDQKNAIKDFAQKKSADAKVTQSKAQDASLLMQKIFKTKKDQAAAFIDEKGNGIIIVVNDIQKSYEPSLESVLEKVRTDLYQAKARKLLDQDLKRASKLAQTVPLEKIKNQYPLARLTTTPLIKKDDTASYEKLLQQKIPVDQMLTRAEKLGETAIIFSEHDGFLVKVQAVEPFDEKDFQARMADIKKDLYVQNKDMAIRGFIASCFDSAKIDISEGERPETQNSLDEFEL